METGDQAVTPPHGSARAGAPTACWLPFSFFLPQSPLEAVGLPAMWACFPVSFPQATFSKTQKYHCWLPRRRRRECVQPPLAVSASPPSPLGTLLVLPKACWVWLHLSGSSVTRITQRPRGGSVRGELGPPLPLSPGPFLEHAIPFCFFRHHYRWPGAQLVGRADPPGQGLCSDTCAFCLPGTPPPPPKRSPAWASLWVPLHSFLLTPRGLGEAHSTPSLTGQPRRGQ